jgi:hypothetical protein
MGKSLIYLMLIPEVLVVIGQTIKVLACVIGLGMLNVGCATGGKEEAEDQVAAEGEEGAEAEEGADAVDTKKKGKKGKAAAAGKKAGKKGAKKKKGG